MQTGPPVLRTPQATVHHGKGLVVENGQRVGMVQVFRAEVLVKKVDVPEFERCAFPQQIGTIETAVEP